MTISNNLSLADKIPPSFLTAFATILPRLPNKETAAYIAECNSTEPNSVLDAIHFEDFDKRKDDLAYVQFDLLSDGKVHIQYGTPRHDAEADWTNPKAFVQKLVKQAYITKQQGLALENSLTQPLPKKEAVTPKVSMDFD